MQLFFFLWLQRKILIFLKSSKETFRIIIYVQVQALIFHRKLKTANLFYKIFNKKPKFFFTKKTTGWKNANNDTFCNCIDTARNAQPLRMKKQQHQSSSSLGRLQDDGYEQASSAAYALPLLCELSTIQVSGVQ